MRVKPPVEPLGLGEMLPERCAAMSGDLTTGAGGAGVCRELQAASPVFAGSAAVPSTPPWNGDVAPLDGATVTLGSDDAALLGGTAAARTPPGSNEAAAFCGAASAAVASTPLWNGDVAPLDGATATLGSDEAALLGGATAALTTLGNDEAPLLGGAAGAMTTLGCDEATALSRTLR